MSNVCIFRDEEGKQNQKGKLNLAGLVDGLSESKKWFYNE
jgi:hypothetical protein